MTRRSRPEVPVDITKLAEVTREGRTLPGLAVKCQRCGHCVYVWGQTDRSRRYGLVLLNETCPEDENNFYLDTEG